MNDCPTCRGAGEVCDVPWTSWKGRPERNPENEECGPCPDCHGEGVRPELLEAFEMLGDLAAMPGIHAEPRKTCWTITVCAACGEHVSDCVCEPEPRRLEPPVRRVTVVEADRAA